MSVKLKLVRHALSKGVSLDHLARMRPPELQKLHRELFGCDVVSGNSEQARRRIAFHVQAEREGGLPVSAREHALALARESSARMRSGTTRNDQLRHSTVTRIVSDHDPRIPMPGSVIVKEYRGGSIHIRVLASGFEWDGRRFASLTAIAKDITGTKWNGLAFFGLAKSRANGD